MSDIVNDYFKRFYPSKEALNDAQREYAFGMERVFVDGFDNIFPRIECADGFSMSVQGHYGAYSVPRADFADSYSRVEIGFPSSEEPLLMPFCETPQTPTETVYGFVPIDVVVEVIKKHGGMADQGSALKKVRQP